MVDKWMLTLFFGVQVSEIQRLEDDLDGLEVLGQSVPRGGQDQVEAGNSVLRQ